MPPIVRKGLRSKQSRGLLGEARAAWSDGNSEAATELATRVFLVEGREAFGPSDKALFSAMLARLEPPAGYRNWDAYFASSAADQAPEDTRTDDKVVDDLEHQKGKTKLHEAAEQGDLAAVEVLLAQGAAVDAVYTRRDLLTTPLFHAITAGHLAVAKRLVEAGAKVAGAGISPVIMAVNSIPMAELVLAQGAKLDAVDSSGRTLLTRIVDTLGKVPLAEFIATKSPVMKDAQQRKVLERAMSQSSPELRELAEQFLARKR